MTYAELKACLKQTNLSPEALAPYFSVSNMTFRRWEKKRAQKIDSRYENDIINGLFRLVADGHLSMDSESFQSLVGKNYQSSAYFDSVLKTLGISEAISSQENFEERISDCLYEIGGKAERGQYVDSRLIDAASKYVSRMGKEFVSRMTSLVKIVQSSEIRKEHKIIAYGALFYLFMPFDFSPDHIPIFGLMDDFAVLGFAVAYYKNMCGK